MAVRAALHPCAESGGVPRKMRGEDEERELSACMVERLSQICRLRHVDAEDRAKPVEAPAPRLRNLGRRPRIPFRLWRSGEGGFGGR